MSLSKLKIKQEIEEGNFFVGSDKDTRIPVENLQFDTISLELHLGHDFRVWEKRVGGDEVSVNPADEEFDFNEYAEKHTESVNLETDGTYLLRSKNFVLCEVYEYVKFPPELCGHVEGKSKLARLGISVHITAPTIQADWDGKITLEIYNHSSIDVRLKPSTSDSELGLIIAQLILEPVEGEISEKDDSFSSSQETALGRNVLSIK